MAEALGWSGLLFATMGTLFLSYVNRSIALVLFVALSIRATAALSHYYIAPLPDGTADAVKFERLAWEWGQDGLITALSAFPGIDAYFYAWLASIVYALTDRSLFFLQVINVFGGILGVLVTWRLAQELWGERAAKKAAWVMALFPMAVQYSALPMREVWFLLFLMIGMIGVVRWARRRHASALVLTICGFLGATLFHGGGFVALLGFFTILGVSALWRLFVGITRGRISFFVSLTLLIVMSLAAAYVSSGISVQKLGTAEQLFSAERWMHYFQSRVYGAARYPEWTQPGSALDFIWAVPLRAAYLLFSPFPWDLRQPAHIIGLIDGALYMALAIFVWRGRRAIWADPGARMVVLVVLPLILAFGVGTGNFGTGLRHRAKFASVLIALAAPRLPRLVWRRGTGSSAVPMSAS